MPQYRVALPLKGIDRNDSLFIPETSCVDIENMRMRKGKFVKSGGYTPRMGAGQNGLFDGIEADLYLGGGYDLEGTSYTIIAGPSLLQVWDWPDDTLGWNPNIGDGSGGGYTLDGARQILNTLGKIIIMPGAPTPADMLLRRIVVFDPLEAAPNDVLALVGGNSINAEVAVTFANRLILIHTYEPNDTPPESPYPEKPTRVRWCANGLIDVWDPTVDSGAGYLEVIETSQYPLTTGFTIGERCFLAKANEILELINTGYTGSNGATFRVESRISSIGVVAPFGVAVSAGGAFFVGRDHIVYAFDGANIKAIGDPVREYIAEMLDETSYQSLRNFNVFCKEDQNEIWFTSKTVDQKRILCYDWQRDSWTQIYFSGDDPDDPEVVSQISRIDSVQFAGVGDDPQESIAFVDEEGNVQVFSETTMYRSTGDSDAPTQTAYTSSVTTRDIAAMRYVGGEITQDMNEKNVCMGVTFRSLPNAVVQVGLHCSRGEAINVGPIYAEVSGSDIESKGDPSVPATALTDFGLRRFFPGQTVTLTGATGNPDVVLNTVEGITMNFSPPASETGSLLGVTLTSDGWINQEVTCDDEGVGRAFFVVPFSVIRLRFGTFNTSEFELYDRIQLQWDKGGFQYR